MLKIIGKIFDKGKRVYDSPNIHELQEYCKEQVDTLWVEVRRFDRPHEYFVDLSYDLWSIKDKLLKEHRYY